MCCALAYSLSELGLWIISQSGQMTGGDDGLWAGRADEWLVSGWPQVACLISWIGYASVEKGSRHFGTYR